MVCIVDSPKFFVDEMKPILDLSDDIVGGPRGKRDAVVTVEAPRQEGTAEKICCDFFPSTDRRWTGRDGLGEPNPFPLSKVHLLVYPPSSIITTIVHSFPTTQSSVLYPPLDHNPVMMVLQRLAFITLGASCLVTSNVIPLRRANGENDTAPLEKTKPFVQIGAMKYEGEHDVGHSITAVCHGIWPGALLTTMSHV